MERKAFWTEVGRFMAHVLPSEEDGAWIINQWFTAGEEYRLAGRSPASLVAAIASFGLAPRLH